MEANVGGEEGSIMERPEDEVMESRAGTGVGATIHEEARPPLVSERQAKAIELIVGGARDAEVAERLRLDSGALSRWRRSPRFRHELGHQRGLSNQSLAALFREAWRSKEKVPTKEWVPYVAEAKEGE
jgi:hypothetical protein